MEIRPIRTPADHDWALREIERLWGAAPGSEEEDLLDILTTLVEAYEEKQYPMDRPDPVEAIKFRMDQESLTRSDLEPILGTRARVAEVLNHRRPLSISMIRRLHDRLRIPAEVLIRETRPKRRVAGKKLSRRAGKHERRGPRVRS
jgi:HTH-type transcriptional regulator / antitoxin HigA